MHHHIIPLNFESSGYDLSIEENKALVCHYFEMFTPNMETIADEVLVCVVRIAFFFLLFMS
jgi:hypothetical protein